MKKIIILIPVYNDGQSLEKLTEDINLKVKNINCKFSIFVINDGSTEEYDDKIFSSGRPAAATRRARARSARASPGAACPAG